MESRFTGSGLGYFGRSLLGLLLGIPSILTLGIVGCWHTCYFQRWIANNTYIDGQQMRFTGTTMGLWVRQIKWLLLTLITVFIYLIVLPQRYQKWIVENTHCNR